MRDGADERVVTATARGGGWLLRLGEREVVAQRREVEPTARSAVTLDGVARRLRVLDHGAEIAVFIDGEAGASKGRSAGAGGRGGRAAGRLTAPMPGRVMQLLVEAGDKVQARRAA